MIIYSRTKQAQFVGHVMTKLQHRVTTGNIEGENQEEASELK